MKMNKLLNIILFSLLFSVTIQAQGEKREKIKALKTAFITQELNLSSADAEKFWPIYNSFQERRYALKLRERDEVKSKMKNNIASMSDAEANAILEKMIFFKNEETKLENELIKKLQEQLQPIQIVKLSKAEHDFKMQMLKKYKGNKK